MTPERENNKERGYLPESNLTRMGGEIRRRPRIWNIINDPEVF